MAQSDPIGVVFDFDGTLTPKKYGSLIKIVENACLPQPWREKCQKLSKVYNENNSLGVHLPTLERNLINITLRAYQECGLRREQWTTALSGVKLRDGVALKIRKLANKGIRVGIISFGVADFIEYILKVNGLAGAVDRVYASRLIYDEASGRVCGWDKRSVVRAFDKCLWSLRFAREYGIAPERLLAVGDSSGDRTLGLDGRLRMGIAKDAEEAKMISPYMGEVVVTRNFALVSDWIDEQICRLIKR